MSFDIIMLYENYWMMKILKRKYQLTGNFHQLLGDFRKMGPGGGIFEALETLQVYQIVFHVYFPSLSVLS